MRIAIASGKGGTGKTTIAVSLALAAPPPVVLLDCDVEEPNGHIFLKPRNRRREPVTVPVPSVDEAKCTSCGECGRICQFHAIVSLGETTLVFPELCHSCGGCVKICPVGAIAETEREIGIIEPGRAGPVELVTGRLHVGEAMSPPLIRAVKRRGTATGLTILDCPPGTSCPVIAAVRDSDYVVLVTEPTPFGLHDLVLAVEMVRRLAIPFGIVINRDGAGDDRLEGYCRHEELPVLLRIPDDLRIAEAYARGEPIVDAIPAARGTFAGLYASIRGAIRAERRGTPVGGGNR